MGTVLDKLNKKIQRAFQEAGFLNECAKVVYSDKEEFADFQCNDCFRLAKQYQTTPMKIAESVIQLIEIDSLVSEVSAQMPGFINMKVGDAALLEDANRIMQSDVYGVEKIGNKQTIVIDYGGANVAKPLHIGHLRSAVIGESIKRIARFFGYYVVGDIHLGDWGLQMGLVITELKERYPEISDVANFDFSLISADLLNEVYPVASSKSKIDDEYLLKAREETKKLQLGDTQERTIWAHVVCASKKNLLHTYSLLETEFDYWYGESDADPYIPQLMQILEEKDLIEEDEGAQIVRVALPDDKKPVPPVIIKKTDGSSIYATTDLATIIQRVEDFNPSHIWYVVDNRQSLHFSQVFRVAYMSSLVQSDVELDFLGFGTMNGSDGKPFKTRDGGVMRLDDLIASTVEGAKEKMISSNFIDEKTFQEAATKIAISAIKFGDLINFRMKDYVFDSEKFLSFEGKTGPYILYSIARINSMLTKMNVDEKIQRDAIKNIHSTQEKDIYLLIGKLPSILHKALDEKAPNVIAENAYQLAILFSRFYAVNNLMKEKDEEKLNDWISLIIQVKKLLTFHLDLLGIQTVDQM